MLICSRSKVYLVGARILGQTVGSVKLMTEVMMYEVLDVNGSGIEVSFSDETYNPAAGRIFEMFAMPGTNCFTSEDP